MGKVQTTYTTSFTPSWYTGYAKDVLSNQAALANQPYQAYQGPRIAGFTPTQQQGFGMTQQAATGYEPMLGKAAEATQGTLGRSSLGVAQPYINRAMDTSALAPAYGALGAAGGMTMASTNPMGLQMASPYMQAAGQSSASLGAQYMNPYMENVINRFGELGARTLQEQLMPAVQNKYIQAGQLGGPTRSGTGASGAPSGMMTDTARALRDVQEGVLKQQQQALAEGWNQATGLAATDLSRMGQLAQTAGGLGTSQQQALAQAGQQMGALGGQYAGIGQNQQQLMATLAGQIASAYGQDTANQLAASGQLAQMAQQQQQQGLAGAAAVTGVGAQQQAMQQANLDLAYQDYLREQGYPQAQIDQMLKTMQGVAPAMPQGSVTSGNVATAGSSTLGSLLGAGLTLGGQYLAGKANAAGASSVK